MHERDPHTGGKDNVPAQDFFDKRLSIGEGVAVGEGGKTIRTHDRIYFSLSSPLHIREKCHS
jgi:hypothetical protein